MSWLYVGMAVAAVVAGTKEIKNNQAQQAQFDSAAKAHDFNAAVQRQRAESTASAFNQREEQQRRIARFEAGKRAAAIAQSGTGFGGSNAAFDEQQAVNAELDALNIRYEGALEARGLLAQSELEAQQAEAARRNRNAINSGLVINTASAALSAAASVYGMGA